MNSYTLTYTFSLTPTSSHQGKIDIFADSVEEAKRKALASVKQIAPQLATTPVIKKVERKS